MSTSRSVKFSAKLNVTVTRTRSSLIGDLGLSDTEKYSTSLYMNKPLQGMASPPPYEYSTALRLWISSLCLPKAPVRAKKLLYQDHLLLCEIQKFLRKDRTTIFRNANFYFFFKRKLCTLFSSLTSHVQQQRSRQDPDIMSVMGWPTHLTQDNFV